MKILDNHDVIDSDVIDNIGAFFGPDPEIGIRTTANIIPDPKFVSFLHTGGPAFNLSSFLPGFLFDALVEHERQAEKRAEEAREANDFL